MTGPGEYVACRNSVCEVYKKHYDNKGNWIVEDPSVKKVHRSHIIEKKNVKYECKIDSCENPCHIVKALSNQEEIKVKLISLLNSR